jgi:hypothetical protein
MYVRSNGKSSDSKDSVTEKRRVSKSRITKIECTFSSKFKLIFFKVEGRAGRLHHKTEKMTSPTPTPTHTRTHEKNSKHSNERTKRALCWTAKD